MRQAMGLLSIVVVLAIGMYIYSKQVHTVTPEGVSTNPVTTIDVVGVKNDIMSIAQAERAHYATNGQYVSLDELVSSGDLSFKRDHRDFYTYSIETSDSGFRVVATYNGPPNPNAPHTISVNENMEFSRE
jgi:hypothetical protein